MNQDTLEEILSCPNLPSLPAVAVRVIELTRNTNVSLDELASTIQNDQALAAKVLRTVNSSFYGLRRRCSTIQQSLVMLGLSTVKSLALGFSLVGSLSPKGGGSDGFDHVSYWRRALYSAIGAKVAARAWGKKFEDEAFLAGLLQDVGMMAMYMALGHRYANAIAGAATHAGVVKAELEAFEVQHPDIGAMLAERWKLPEELVIPVKYHERPTASPQEHADCVRCVALGNLLHDVLTEEDSAGALRRAYARGKAWMNFDTPTLDQLVREVGANAKELSKLFTLDTGEYRSADEVLMEAEKRLVELTSAGPDGEAMSALLQEHCRTDPLTGAVCRDEFVFEVRSAFERCARAREALAVVFVGMDSVGRGAFASESLVAAAVILKKHFDPVGGVLARWGEETFALVLPGTGAVAACRLAEVARADFERASGSAGGVGATASFGLASIDSWGEGSRMEVLLAAASKAMEVARSGGGNAVRAFRGAWGEAKAA